MSYGHNNIERGFFYNLIPLKNELTEKLGTRPVNAANFLRLSIIDFNNYYTYTF